MAMSKAQTEYAMTRLETAYKGRVKAIEAAYGWEDSLLSLEAKWDFIKKGLVQPTNPPQRYTRWDEIFDFSFFEVKKGLSQQGENLLQELKIEYQAAKDSVMLGDAKEALDLVSSFQKEVL